MRREKTDRPQLLLYYTRNVSAPYVEDFDGLPFDLDVLRSHGERLIMASAAWQVWLMRVRAVYQWEHPASTMKWLALYILLWQTGKSTHAEDLTVRLTLCRPDNVLYSRRSVPLMPSAC